MMVAILIVGIAVVVLTGAALLTGNRLMEKAVHADSLEAEEYLASASKASQQTSA